MVILTYYFPFQSLSFRTILTALLIGLVIVLVECFSVQFEFVFAVDEVDGLLYWLERTAFESECECVMCVFKCAFSYRHSNALLNGIRIRQKA